jgi:hypothetical protein
VRGAEIRDLVAEEQAHAGRQGGHAKVEQSVDRLREGHEVASGYPPEKPGLFRSKNAFAREAADGGGDIRRDHATRGYLAAGQ